MIGEKSKTRRSVDKVVNREGRILVDKIEERGWSIMNGRLGREGGWTFVGQMGRSAIDYVITNEKAAEEIRVVKGGDRTESDHLPLKVEIEGPELRGSERKQWVKVIKRSDWTEEGIGYYHLKSEGWVSTEEGNDGARNELKKKVKESIKKNKLKITPWRLGKGE